MIISEDAFEIHSGLRISNGFLEKLVQGRVEESSNSFQKFGDHRKQSFDERQFQLPVPDIPEEISKRLVVRDSLSQQYDRIGYKGKHTISSLCIQIGALASSEFQMLLGLEDQDFNIPADLELQFLELSDDFLQVL